MTLSILGQDYDFQEIDADKDVKMENCDGYCDGFGKIIRVNNNFNTNCTTNVSDLEGYKRRVKRHEIVHAFFEESGLEKYRVDELIVEWIANQFLKMEKAFQQVGAL